MTLFYFESCFVRQIPVARTLLSVPDNSDVIEGNQRRPLNKLAGAARYGCWHGNIIQKLFNQIALIALLKYYINKENNHVVSWSTLTALLAFD
jgi:hypothetical protein